MTPHSTPRSADLVFGRNALAQGTCQKGQMEDGMGSSHTFTRGYFSLPLEIQERAVEEFRRRRSEVEDWFYSLADGRVYAQENGTGGFTFLLPEEY